MTEDYEDIIHLPHHVSATRPQMARSSRAAQFAPFAALSGYEAEIRETARLTEKKIEPDELTRALLDEKLRLLQEHSLEQPEIEILYFRADGRKEGGAYVTASGRVKRIDELTCAILLTDGRRIPVEDVLDISGDLFALLETQGF